MASGFISPTLIPGWPSPVVGVMEQLYATLHAAGFLSPPQLSPEGFFVGDVATAQNFLASYVGSASELQFWKTKQQAALDAFFNAGFDLNAFIRAGTVPTVTAANVGNFIAQWTNNYRTLRANIAAATTVAAVQAINVQSGWPNNP